MSNETKPIIFSIDDDEQVLRALRSDLREHYRKEYRIISTDSAEEALAALEELKKKNEEVALFLSDQRMPEMLGVDFLERARPFFPRAKRVLLTAYSDTDAAIKAINDVNLDYYLLKPWNPPSEKLYPVLDDLLADWRAVYRPKWRGMRIIGYQYSPKSHDLKDFLAGNLRPYQWIDAGSSEAEELCGLHAVDTKKLPVVLFEDGTVLNDPSLQEVAERVGLNPHERDDLYDVTIIGAGPAGLAAAVYGGSEGLKTLLIEKRAAGGQAGTSSRIENYLGFPNGVSGSDLSRRALTQAQRFGVDMLSPQEVTHIEVKDGYKILTLGDDSTVKTRALIITTGVEYRKLPAEGVDEFSGAGVYYGAATTEAQGCQDKQIYVVGGGNSAGQGAVYLSQFAKQVTILVRSPDLNKSMSSYLIDQIDNIDNIRVQGRREITKVGGSDDHLESICIEDLDSGEIVPAECDALFIFIGARPYTDWLESGDVLRNKRGFIVTGNELTGGQHPGSWTLERPPFLLETCQPGVFAAGDVRQGAMNRVASAVGEGAMAVKFVHEYLATV